MPYPRKQTLVIFIICAVAVGGLAFYVYKPSLGAVAQTLTAPIAVATGENSQPLPTSSDWQSQFLVSTTSAKAFKTASAAQAASAEAADQPLTATDLLGREFFTNYMQLHQAGLDTDTDAVNNLSDQLANDSEQSVQAPKIYSLSDLHVTDADDAATLETYSHAVVGIFAADVPDQNHNEAVIAEQALDSGDMSGLKQLDPVIAGYQTALSDLLSMPVPAEVADYHLDLVNGVAIALSNAQALRKADTDPVASLSALQFEVVGLQDMSDGMAGIGQYDTAAGVQFN